MYLLGRSKETLLAGYGEVEFVTHVVPFIVDEFRQELVTIGSAHVGRVTANIRETTASITFLAVYRNDGGTYNFIVHNENYGTDQTSLDIQVHTVCVRHVSSRYSVFINDIQTFRDVSDVGF